ncbi:hypothetical protein [Kitasatospora sp. NPDC088783]|uniref:hypothetical protein n=1 Tax=Kitasatospora sp. NPDC088783 TaxID=3364077 RepID=UPI00380BE5E9
MVQGGYRQSAYALVPADGSWAVHDRIGESSVPFLPPLTVQKAGYAELVRVHLPDGIGYDISTPVGPNPTDRTVTFLRRTEPDSLSLTLSGILIAVASADGSPGA